MGQTAMHELIENQVVIGERNYESALDLVINTAERELLIFDQDLSKGGYTSLKRFEMIRDFLSKGRHVKLVIVIHNPDYFVTQCPRIYELLAIYGHVITVYQTNDQARVAKDTFVVVDGKHYVRRFHIDQPRFKYAFDDIETCAMLKIRFDELLQATSHTISVTALGL